MIFTDQTDVLRKTSNLFIRQHLRGQKTGVLLGNHVEIMPRYSVSNRVSFAHTVLGDTYCQ